MKCQVCDQNPSVGVASSCLAPMSIAFCQPCLVGGYEPMGTIVSALMGATSFDQVTVEATATIRSSLAFHGVSEADLWISVAKLDAEYDQYCAAQPSR